jgi:hypothetical protein
MVKFMQRKAAAADGPKMKYSSVPISAIRFEASTIDNSGQRFLANRRH